MFWTILGLIAFGAIVNGPLFSLDASGAIGKALVFTKWKGRNVVREYVTPANPNSILQRGRRTMVSVVNKIWQSMTDVEQNSWLGLAAATNVSSFNAFTGFNLDLQTAGEAPVTEADIVAVLPSGIDTGAASPGNNRIEFDSAAFATAAGTYSLVSLTEGGAAPGKDFARIVGYADNSSNAVTVITVTDLPAGTYSATIWQISDTGGVAAAVADILGIVVTGV